MKKSLIILSVLLLTLSCGREERTWLQQPVTFTATASGTRTRTLFSLAGGDIRVAWAPDDTIGIWSSAATRGNYPYTAAVDKTNPASALFNCVSEETMFLFDGSACTYYAYYPWQGGFSAVPTVSFGLPALQTQSAEGDVAHLAALNLFRAEPVTVSGTSAQADFSFSPALTTLHLALKMAGASTVNVPVRRIKLLSTGAPLSADAASLDLSNPASVPVTDAGEQEVALAFGTMPVLDPDHDAEAWLTVLPGAHNAGLTAEVTAVDGSIATVALPAATFLGGKVYTRSLEFHVEDFVPAEPFDVQAASLTVNAGEALTFNITGMTSGISFYSGEKFHDYGYADADRFESPKVSFKHAIAAGTQNNHPYVKVSSDFNGNMNEADILAATWKDISAHFTFSTENLGTDNPITSSKENYDKYFVDSGEYDLASEYAGVDSLYIAMFWHADEYDATLLNTRTVSYITRFRVGDWEMSPSGLTLVWDTDKWTGVSASNTPQWQTPKTANGVPDYPAFRFMSDFRPTADRDAYAVANKAFKRVNYGHDKPFMVQEASADTPATYTYTFTEPGTYTAVFVASCPTLSGDKTETRTFTITVN